MDKATCRAIRRAGEVEGPVRLDSNMERQLQEN
jgi:hypothetical protein